MRVSDVGRLVPLVRMVPLAASIALAAACAEAPAAPARADEATVRAALTTELAKFGPAIATKDAAGVAKLFTEDGTWILPDATTYSGRANIEAGAKKFFETFESASMGQMVIDKLITISDSEALTFSHGTYSMTETGKPPANHVNPFADYWKKGNDGVWHVAYEVNADGPAPPAQP
jgi:uncharacterized protein (TIGR02246 family)